jgi:Domain of unknown function (DUF4382)
MAPKNWPISLPLVFTMFFFACGGTGPARFSQGGSGITLTVSDPATCSPAAAGPYSHIYVSISDVQASPNPNAVSGDTSFVDLTPGLNKAPHLVDLLGTPNQCFLATIGTNLTLPAGTYQHFRVFLAANGTSVVPGSPCGSFANCLTLASDALHTPRDLQIGAEATAGIPIPANRIGGGGFTVDPTRQQVLNLNFDACASVVALSGNAFRFKPVLLAGDATTANSISGQLVDSASHQPIANSRVIVALEQPDTRGVDRVLMESVADPDGKFNLCPVPQGSYDVVAGGLRTDTGAAYAATATLGVPVGSALGAVPLLLTGAPNSGTTVSGTATTSTFVNNAPQPASADVTISALQLMTVSGVSTTNLTIPLLGAPASTLNIATQAAFTCPANTDCAGFSALVSPANPNVGVFNAAGTQYSQNAGLVNYSMEGSAFAPVSAAAPDCNPSFQAFNVNNVTPAEALDFTTLPLSFTGCQ